MVQLYTPVCEGGFEEITLDDTDSLEKEIQGLLKKVEQQTDEDEVERQLKMFKSEGLIQSYEGDRDYSKEGGIQMSRSIDQNQEHQKEWEKNRFKQFSQEELNRIEAQDEEREKAQAYIDEQVKKCVEEHPDRCSSEERNKEIAEAKKKREEERWRQFHWMGKKSS